MAGAAALDIFNESCFHSSPKGRMITFSGERVPSCLDAVPLGVAFRKELNRHARPDRPRPSRC